MNAIESAIKDSLFFSRPWFVGTGVLTQAQRTELVLLSDSVRAEGAQTIFSGVRDGKRWTLRVAA